jgi:hypothetical protein
MDVAEGVEDQFVTNDVSDVSLVLPASVRLAVGYLLLLRRRRRRAASPQYAVDRFRLDPGP